MFALGIEYLTGVAYASDVGSREQAEWPPHPDRVFMALVAAHKECDGNDQERRALHWLERLPSAALTVAPPGGFRTTTTSFVPVNDATAPRLSKSKTPSPGQIDTGVALLPDRRSRQPRTFPAAPLTDPTVFLVWPGVDVEAEVSAALSVLCRKVTRIGHSASLVQMWVESAPPPVTLAPAEGQTRTRLRVPGPGRFDALEQRFAAGLRPTAAPWQSYGPSTIDAGQSARGTCFSPEILIFTRVSGRRLGLESTALLVEAFRKAVLKHAQQPLVEWVSGHQADGAPSQAPHLALVPLADVDHPHADGHLLGVGLVCPGSVSADDIARELGPLIGATETGEIGLVSVYDGSALDWEVELDLRAARPRALDAETWTRSRTGSRRWATVTPIALDRYPKQAGDTEQTIVRACAFAGMPPPCDVIASRVSLLEGVPPASTFSPLRTGRGAARYHTHAVLTFEEPVCGPVLIGAGRYRGYGLCRPLHEGGR